MARRLATVIFQRLLARLQKMQAGAGRIEHPKRKLRPASDKSWLTVDQYFLVATGST
ncbi:hypothetical protein ROE7235_00635 [Roseibaca ekhonensis]|uniref:Uncharacterized protein n=1 Tax=Roseinatronobacter ekhonensis TaxID=254356 RepID=A0A3B0M452_9RHOB|nr:hypothetical protein ROE7235_00635 [Roseibaca ekhonensis]